MLFSRNQVVSITNLPELALEHVEMSSDGTTAAEAPPSDEDDTADVGGEDAPRMPTQLGEVQVGLRGLRVGDC